MNNCAKMGEADPFFYLDNLGIELRLIAGPMTVQQTHKVLDHHRVDLKMSNVNKPVSQTACRYVTQGILAVLAQLAHKIKEGEGEKLLIDAMESEMTFRDYLISNKS
jgi:hypothetical protein